MENKLKILTSEIQKQSPSILDLEYGCEVEYKKQKCSIIHFDRSQKCGLLLVLSGNGSIIKQNEIFDKIIGRKITLEDVLRVIPACTTMHYKRSYTQNKSWIAFPHETGEEWWELGKTLSKQKPEIINFLYQLICKRNE